MDLPPALEPYRDALLRIAKPSATFEAVPSSGDLDVRASKMGGVPFNPRWTDWPSAMVPDGHLTTKKRPMAFIGQFNFAEIVAAVPELKGLVPDQGLLQLFYDLEEGVWDHDPNFVHVAWHPDIDSLDHVPVEPPVASYPAKEYALRFRHRLSFPDFIPEEVEFPDELQGQYVNTLLYDQHHQIGGFPIAVQYDVIDNVLDKPGETPWHLAIQVDSDKQMELRWADQGTIYLCVQAENLATAPLEQSRFYLQSL